MKGVVEGGVKKSVGQVIYSWMSLEKLPRESGFPRGSEGDPSLTLWCTGKGNRTREWSSG